MNPREILARLRRKPFQPFRIFTSDGASFEIRHPEMAFVTSASIEIGLEPNQHGVFTRVAWVAPLHVAHLEVIEAEAPVGDA